MNKILLAGTVIMLSACNGPATDAPVAPAPQAEAAQAAPPVAASARPASAIPAFVDKVWKVSASSAVDAGMTYVFLSNGQLVIDSPNGAPLHGNWTYEKGALSVIEEGLTYAVDIVRLDADAFQIRIHTPGGATDVALVPAPEVPLPAVR